MRILFIAIIALAFACGENKEPKKEVVVVPPNALFIVNAEPQPVAFKVDTTKDWVILDSSATLRALLKSIEDNYKRAVNIRRSQDTTQKK